MVAHEWVFFLITLAFGFGLTFFLVFIFILKEWLSSGKTDKPDKFNCSNEKEESIEEESLK